MPKKKKNQIVPTDSENVAVEETLLEKIKKTVDGLWYMSETDAEIFPFAGDVAQEVSGEVLLRQSAHSSDTPVEERSFTELFGRLTKIHDWFNTEAKFRAERFGALQKLLEENLTDLKVFKVGKIQIDIYIVGLDKQGKTFGIQTKAVET